MEVTEPRHLYPQVLRQRANEDPDGAHIIHIDGTTRTHHQSLNASLKWAGILQKFGLSRGDHVLSLLPNGVDTYDIWTGACWLGAVESALNTDYRGQMLRHAVNTSAARILVVPEQLLSRVVEVADALPSLETVIVPDMTDPAPDLPQRVVTKPDLIDIESTTDTGPDPNPWDTCCVIWTSGTTGPSKGVMMPWAELHCFTPPVTFGPDVMYHFLPPYHVGGKLLLYAALLAGNPVVMRESFSVSGFWEDVRNHDVTRTILYGPLVQMLMSVPYHPGDHDNPLRTMGCGPLPPNLEEFLDRFGLDGANTYYGMTEIGLPFCSDGMSLPNTESCGRLRPGFEVRIVDEHDYPVTDGEVGQLIVRSDLPWTMNAGYLGMPEQTAAAWRNGWFHTGDAFRVDDDGNYYFVDRFKDAIRRRGENISSFEVESYVSEHPEVSEVAAVAVASELGEDDVKVVVVRAVGGAVAPDELLDWLRSRMPRFMLPRYIEFVGALPRTPGAAKVRKAELRRQGVTDDTWDRESAGIVV